MTAECCDASASQTNGGIESSSNSFLYAGSKNLIVSHWSVETYSTELIMIEFFDKMGDLNVKDSLRNAKIKILNNEIYNHPFYWAPFIHLGT